MPKKTNGRICIVVPGGIFSTPYLKRYITILESINLKYDLILWRGKSISEESSSYQDFVYDYEISSTSSKWKKLWGYLGFMRFASKILRKNQYEKVLVLTGNTAVLLNRVLTREYPGRYLVDIRDYFMENNRFYYGIEKKAIENSGITVISSKGFKSFLPKHDYVIAHNFTPVTTTNNVDARGKSDIITMSYIGNMRFVEQDKKLLALFSNDNRYHICLNGKGYGELRDYCTQIGMKNVTIVDFFKPEETTRFYDETDIVLNLYGNHTPLLDYALSNKLYYAAQYHKPILVCKDTFMSEISRRYQFGFEFDLDNSQDKDALYQWYMSLDWDALGKGCDDFIKEVKEEDDTFVMKVKQFLQ